jgi:tRNA-modifying protein YgfZ
MATAQIDGLRDDDLRDEYRVLRERCGVVDRSERGKLALTGAGAVEFLNGQVTNELLDLRPGEGRYAAFLTNKGKMLGDLRVLAVGEDGGEVRELLLDTERVALQALFDMIRRYSVGYDVELDKRTLQCALHSLIGPDAPAVAARATGLSEAELPGDEHAHLGVAVGESPVRLIATTDGLDVLCVADLGDAVAAALRAAGAEPVSEAAAEILRVERGRPRYGLDVDTDTIPQEAGLNEHAVSFTKGCYVGQETVARLYYRGKPNRHLRGLRLFDPAPPGAELRLGERVVGHLGSIVVSPQFGPIGLALVRREAAPGDVVSVGELAIEAELVELPFR